VKGRRHESDAHKLISEIARLYQLETKVQSRPIEHRLALRKNLIRPWLDSFMQRVDDLLKQRVGSIPLLAAGILSARCFLAHLSAIRMLFENLFSAFDEPTLPNGLRRLKGIYLTPGTGIPHISKKLVRLTF